VRSRLLLQNSVLLLRGLPHLDENDLPKQFGFELSKAKRGLKTQSVKMIALFKDNFFLLAHVGPTHSWVDIRWAPVEIYLIHPLSPLPRSKITAYPNIEPGI